ncbi:MAG: polyketide synthase, partial [Gammaproteobacteria bacterium]|nr:polyketide synthase [Gammaproteobacteria bacterium]
QTVLSSLRRPEDKSSDVGFLLNALGRLWLAGWQVDWPGFYADERRHRLPLPSYPFERQRYWIDPPGQRPQRSEAVKISEAPSQPGKKPDIADWFYLPSWKLSAPPAPREKTSPASSWLVFEDECGLGSLLVKKLQQQGQEVVTVKPGTAFARFNDHGYTLNPRQSGDYETLLEELHAHGKIPQTIVHLWTVT